MRHKALHSATPPHEHQIQLSTTVPVINRIDKALPIAENHFGRRADRVSLHAFPPVFVQKYIKDVTIMIDLTKDNCDAEVREEKELPVVVDFWGPKCPPCLELKPLYHDMEKDFVGKVKFTAVDCAANKRVAMSFRVMSLPTFLFWKDGAEVKRLTGDGCTIETIRAEIENLIK